MQPDALLAYGHLHMLKRRMTFRDAPSQVAGSVVCGNGCHAVQSP